jgi:hypothetical protein
MRFGPLLVLVALAGCGQSEAPSPKATREAREARVKKAQEAAAQPPRVQRHAVAGGELLVLEVPVALPYGLVDMQHCFIWRDAEFRSASMTCPNADAAPVGRAE